MRKVRTREPFRRQGVMRFEMPEDSLAEDHRARLSWQVVETLAWGDQTVSHDTLSLLCALPANLVTHAAAWLG